MHKIFSFIGSQTYTNLILTVLAVVLTVLTVEFVSLANHPFRASIPVDVSGEVSISGHRTALGLSEPIQVEIQR
jgi:hypothetical protein